MDPVRRSLRRSPVARRPVAIAAMAVLIASVSACVVTPPLPGPGESPATTTSEVPEAEPPATNPPTNGQPSLPPGCDTDATARIFITGLVRMPDGSPPAGPALRKHAVLRDRALQPGAELALASVNDAGFFLLRPTLIVSPDCPKSYVIEVTLVQPDGTTFAAELDVTDLAIAAAPGPDIIDADITSTPIVLAAVE